MKETKHFIFVVEGKKDAERLIKLGIKDVVITKGNEVPRETINYLKALEKKHKIVIFTDSDGAGIKIREKLNANLTAAINLSVPKSAMIGNKKVGLEHMKSESLATILAPYLHTTYQTLSNLTLFDLIKNGYTGPSSQAKRRELAKRHTLIYGRAKKMYQALLLLDINKEDIENK